MSRAYLYLAVAIIAEVAGTSALKASKGFSRPLPSLVVIVGYGVAFYGLSLCLKSGLSVGVTYAIWSGVGIVLIATVGAVVYSEKVDFAAVMGFALVVAGVIVSTLSATQSGGIAQTPAASAVTEPDSPAPLVAAPNPQADAPA
jgi:small multidrug resistance pump